MNRNNLQYTKIQSLFRYIIGKIEAHLLWDAIIRKIVTFRYKILNKNSK